MATLLGEWGFLDNLDDTSGHDHHGSANFVPVYTSGPQPDTRAVVLNDATHRIEYGRTGLEPADADGGIVSMAWVKLNASHVNYTEIIAKLRAVDSTKAGIKLYNNQAWFMARWADRIGFTSYGNLNDGLWHHIALVDAYDRYEFYIDGVSQTSGGSTTGANVWNDFPWGTGANPQATVMATSVDMLVSGIRIFAGTMTSGEVNDWMNTPIVGEVPLSPPTILTTSPEPEQITLTWTDVPAASSYRVRVDGVARPDVITDTSFTITGLTQGQLYSFEVVAWALEGGEWVQTAPSAAVEERACYVVTAVPCLTTGTDDPNTGTINEQALAFLPDGTPGVPYLGWRWNSRQAPNHFYWWERESAPRTAVYAYLGPWADGMTIEKVSGETIRVVEWVRGSDRWRQTDLVNPGDTVTLDFSDLTMNAGTGSEVGGDVLNCTLIEHALDIDDGWVARIWGYHPVPLPVETLTVDDTVEGQLTATWTGVHPDYEVRIDEGAWTAKGAATEHVFEGLVDGLPHDVEVRYTTPHGPGETTLATATAPVPAADLGLLGSSEVTAAYVGTTPVLALAVGAVPIGGPA